MMVLLYSKILVSIIDLGSPSALLSPSPPKNKNKNSPLKSQYKFLIFSEMELSSSNVKKIFIFSQGRAFPRKVFLHWVKKCPVFSPNAGKCGPEITPYLDTFHALLYFLKKKHFLYFQKWNPAFLSRRLKNKRNPPQETKIDFSDILGNVTFEHQT